MKYSSISILCAALTVSASAFVSPSSVAKRTVVPIAFEIEKAAKQTCRYSTQQSTQGETVATQDHTVDEVIHDLLKVSQFVYGFANMRRIVKENEGQERKKKTGWFSSEEYKVEYVTPAHILTQDGGQQKDENKLLLYVVTPDAIKQFMEENRKWFKEPEGGGDWEFDETVTEKTEPFLKEKMIEEARRDNMKIIDYVSNDRSGDKTYIFFSSMV